MKKSLAVFLGMVLSHSAFATSTISTVAQCSLLQPGVDAGTIVTVTEYTGPGTIGRAPVLSAVVDNFMLMRHNKTTFSGLTEKRPVAGSMGGAWIFSGKDFSLELETDSPVLPGGRIFARLTYENGGRRISNEMACDPIAHLN